MVENPFKLTEHQREQLRDGFPACVLRMFDTLGRYSVHDLMDGGSLKINYRPIHQDLLTRFKDIWSVTHSITLYNKRRIEFRLLQQPDNEYNVIIQFSEGTSISKTIVFYMLFNNRGLLRVCMTHPGYEAHLKKDYQ